MFKLWTKNIVLSMMLNIKCFNKKYLPIIYSCLNIFNIQMDFFVMKYKIYVLISIFFNEMINQWFLNKINYKKWF